MARSEYIYVVLQRGVLSRAFTVEYEMDNYLSRLEDVSHVRAYRLRDGSTTLHEPVELNIRDMKT